MKAVWLVILATVFYTLVVILFWPIERQILPASVPATDRSGYQHRVVQFSDSHVTVRVPTTQVLQELGLGGVTTLRDSEGMLWLYSPPQRVTFWMKGMLIPLDFIWVQNGQIVNITENVPPPVDPTSSELPIIDPGVPVDAVLEVASGFTERFTLHIGDLVTVDPAPQY